MCAISTPFAASSAPACRRAARRGFSLAEILVIVGIMATVSALVAPDILSSMNAYRLNAGLSELAGKLTEAKFKAQSQNNDYEIVLDTIGNGYSLEYMTDASTRSFAVPAYESEIMLPTNVSLGFGSLTTPAGDPGDQPSLAQSASICFNSQGMPVDNNGQPTAANAFYLTSQGQYGAVTVSLAGRVQIWLWSGSQWNAE